MRNALHHRWRALLGVIREPDLYQMVIRIYFPILFPLTFLIVLTALTLDRAIGWTQIFTPPLNYYVAAASFVSGALLWAYTYAVLIYGGDGSPSPAIRRTQKLVTWGIYARCRNPSIHGKLLGVLAVGFLINSPAFSFVLVPLLLAGSLIEKVWRQEPVLIEIFGEEYLEYRRRVPLFLPRIFVPPDELRGIAPRRAARDAAESG
jgi:protein-S-isoprenylcysteine O-methyltransferase Ste14